VTTADSSVRKRAISWSKAILRAFGISALTNGIATLHHAYRFPGNPSDFLERRSSAVDLPPHISDQ
jgi:hypothetical protein